jgi:hypothetical protein
MVNSGSPVPVEWAWRGKLPTQRDYGILACSQGRISDRNFEDILDRFSPGTLDTLPEVSLSYIKESEASRYLGISIHESRQGGYDKLGRDVTFTRYFCMQYDALAPGAVSYLSVFKALGGIRLPSEDGGPLAITVTPGDNGAPIDFERAAPVAGLLLTGNPICIVDANSTEMTGRLAYIDAVMSLLPYGFRAEMAAATWTSSTYRGHKFRLFFSDARRTPSDQYGRDHVFSWETMAIDLAPVSKIQRSYAEDYRDLLLKEGPEAAKRLARHQEPRQFRVTDALKAVELIQVKPRIPLSERLRGKHDSGEAPQVPAAGHADLPPPGERREREDPIDRVEHLLSSCARFVSTANSADLEVALAQLRDILDGESGGLAVDRRPRYWNAIQNYALLRAGQRMRKDPAGFYKLMLRVAFGDALSYLNYCQIEGHLRGKPDKALLDAIDQLTDSTDEPHLKLIVRRGLDGKYPNYSCQRLVEMSARQELRVPHAREICAITIEALSRARQPDITKALPVLGQHRYLAPALQGREPANLEYQVATLTELLRAVYRDGMNDEELADVLAGRSAWAPTIALLLAVCRLTSESRVYEVYLNFMLGLAQSQEVPGDIRFALAERGFVAKDEQAPTRGLPAGSGPDQTRSDPLPGKGLALLGELTEDVKPGEKKGRIKSLLIPSGSFRKASEKEARHRRSQGAELGHRRQGLRLLSPEHRRQGRPAGGRRERPGAELERLTACRRDIAGFKWNWRASRARLACSSLA